MFLIDCCALAGCIHVSLKGGKVYGHRRNVPANSDARTQGDWFQVSTSLYLSFLSTLHIFIRIFLEKN